MIPFTDGCKPGPWDLCFQTDLSSVPNTYNGGSQLLITPCFRRSDTFTDLCRHQAHMVHRDTCQSNIHMFIKQRTFKFKQRWKSEEETIWCGPDLWPPHASIHTCTRMCTHAPLHAHNNIRTYLISSHPLASTCCQCPHTVRMCSQHVPAKSKLQQSLGMSKVMGLYTHTYDPEELVFWQAWWPAIKQ